MTKAGEFERARDIRMAIVGYGGSYNIPKIHLTDMKRAGMTIDSVVDVNAERRRAAEKEFGVTTYSSVKEFLKKGNADVVTIVTPHNTHAKLAVQCLSAGKHVICEKPFAITTAECDAMIREAKKRRRMLSVYHNRHWDGCILEAVTQIKKRKAIGDVFRIEVRGGGYGRPGKAWRHSKSISGGILYDMGAHFLEWALQLIDGEIVEVSGFQRSGFWSARSPWKEDANEDEMLVVVRFTNRVALSLCISSIDAAPKTSFFKVIGTRGAYLMDHGGYRILKPKSGEMDVREGKNRDQKWADFYRNIVSHLVKRTDLAITAEWARRTIHIMDLAERSAAQGKALRARYR